VCQDNLIAQDNFYVSIHMPLSVLRPNTPSFLISGNSIHDKKKKYFRARSDLAPPKTPIGRKNVCVG
jgi:hypothetical protein